MAKSSKSLHDAQRNARLAWLSQNIAKGQTNTQLIIGLMAAFKCSEKVARDNLKEVYDRFGEIEAQYIGDAKTKFMEMGMVILNQCLQLCQMGPAVNQYKILATIGGVSTEKTQIDHNITTTNNPAPSPEIVRERIQNLIKSKKVREEAEVRDIDLLKLKKDLVDDPNDQD